jgi:hypothetical protein
MPKLPFDYSKTVIYKIVCNDLLITDCYVGHTTDFIRRKQLHKCSCCNKNNRFDLNVYKFIREHGGWSNWSMIEVEKYPCNDINEATARERYWFENLKATLNCNIPNRTKKEWEKENKEQLKEYMKEYYEENKEKISKKKTCDCGSIYINKSQHEKSKKHLIYVNKNI